MGKRPGKQNGETKKMLFQMFSRPFDLKGIHFRLMLCYDSDGNVTAAYEARNSSPNMAADLRRTHKQLPTFHLSQSEYARIRFTVDHLIERTD